MELEVMKLKPEFIDYFLFLSDLICWAKDTGIVVGPGRGSAAASLVCYLLRITEVDPITVPTMVFERFMDASRTDPPDIDIDIADEDRWKLVTYLKEHYGYANVGNVANIIRYRGKSALDKVGIIYRIPNCSNEILIQASPFNLLGISFNFLPSSFPYNPEVITSEIVDLPTPI